MHGDHKQSARLDFQVSFSPDRALQIHATMEIIEALALPNDDFRAHCFDCAPLVSGNRGFPSAFLMVSQSVSISSRGRSLNSWPSFRASLSISRKRRENFALALLSAISGSIFKKRERFTAAKSKSPSSSSVFKGSVSVHAFFSSSISSCIFSKTPFASSQSNPVRDALRVS